jgi:hypothetical protein
MTEAERVAAAKAKLAPTQNIAYSDDVAAAKGPSADQLAQAYADQSGVVPPPAEAPAPQPAKPQDVSVDDSITDLPQTSLEKKASDEVAREMGPAAVYNPRTLESTVPANPNPTPKAYPPLGPGNAYGAGTPGELATEADRVAAARQKLTGLDASRQLAAAGRLNATTPQARAVLVSPGGMRPNTEALKVEQGPQVAGADDLLRDIEFQGTKSAADNATAELKRDTALAGLQEQNTGNVAKFAGEEAKIGQSNSDALAKVSDRMQAAIDRSNVPVVSPAQDLNEMGIGQKIAFALAAAGGGIAGRANGTNPFLQGFDQMVDARIKTQMQQVEQAKGQAGEQQNLYGVLRKGFDDDAQARAGLRVMYLQALDSKLKESALHYGIDSNDARYVALQAGLSQQLLTEREKLAQLSGQRLSEETTKKYAPPQVAVVGAPGGIDKGRLDKRNAIGKELESRGLNKNLDDLDALNSYIRNNDKGGVIQQYMDHHPGSGWFQSFANMQKDPAQRQATVDLQRGVQSEFGEKGMRSEGGQAVVKALTDPNLAPEAYNRLAHDTRNGIDRVISPFGPEGYQEFNSMRQTESDIENAPGSSTTAVGSEDLPNALPEPPDSLAANAPAGTPQPREKKAKK